MRECCFFEYINLILSQLYIYIHIYRHVSSWVRHDYANIIVKGGEVSNQEGNVTNKCFSIGSVSYWKKETWNHIFLMRPFQLQRHQCFDPQPYGVLMCFVLAWKLGPIDPHRFQVVRLGMTHHGRFVGCLILAHARGVETQTTFKKMLPTPCERVAVWWVSTCHPLLQR